MNIPRVNSGAHWYNTGPGKKYRDRPLRYEALLADELGNVVGNALEANRSVDR